MKVVIPILLLLVMPVQAEVYKKVTPEGEVIYSDVRTDGAKPINVPKAQTYTPPPLPVSTTPPEQGANNGVYSSFVIDSPQHTDTVRDEQGNVEYTVRDNLGNLELLVTAEPELKAQDGHRIQYYLDGEPHGRPTVDLRKTFISVDRGEHKLSAAILDNQGRVIIRTALATVFLHRVSSQHPDSLTNPDNPDSPLYKDPGDLPAPGDPNIPPGPITTQNTAPVNRDTTIPLRTIPPLNPAPVNRQTTIPRSR